RVREERERGHEYQESSASSAKPEQRRAAINVFREIARYSTMSQHRPSYPPATAALAQPFSLGLRPPVADESVGPHLGRGFAAAVPGSSHQELSVLRSS